MSGTSGNDDADYPVCLSLPRIVTNSGQMHKQENFCRLHLLLQSRILHPEDAMFLVHKVQGIKGGYVEYS
jgi:hypothetical protein